MKISAILFDKDGCLLDFDKTWGQWAKSLLAELSEGDTALMKRMADRVGFDPERVAFDPSSAVIAGTPEDGVELLLPMLPDWSFERLLAFSNERAAQAELEPVVPLGPLLDEMRRMKLALGVATNDSEGTARRHMDALGVADRFDMILGSDSGYGGKPAPGMQHAFLGQMKLAAEASIMVGDSLHDLHSGRAAGMICVGVLTGPARREELEPAADVILPDIGHLPEWINAQV